MRLDRRQGLLPVGGGVHQVAGREQNILYQLQDSRFIVHYENNRLLFHNYCRLQGCGANWHPPIVLFGHSQKKLNFISLEDRHGVASLQSLNQSSLAFPSPLRGRFRGR